MNFFSLESAKEEFEKENGMSISKAIEYIRKWKNEGKNSQAKKGCLEVLKFFPKNEEVTKILQEINSEENFENSQSDKKKEDQKKSEVSDNFSNKFFGSVKKVSNLAADKIQNLKKDTKNLDKNQEKLAEIEPPDGDEKILAAVGYFWLFAIIPLLLKRDSKFVQFHAWQGLILTGFFSLFNTFIFSFITIIFPFFNIIIKFLGIGIYVWGAFSAYSGKWLRIPGIFLISEKFRKMF